MSLKADITARLRSIAETMRRLGWGALVVTSPEAVQYFSGALIHTQALIRRRQATVVITQDSKAVLIVAAVEKALAARLSLLDSLDTYDEFESSACAAAGALLRSRIDANATIAIEKTHLPAVDFECLSALLPLASFVAGDDILAEMRIAKSADELDAVAFVASVMDEAISTAVGRTVAGLTEVALANDITCIALQLGGGRIRDAIGLVAAGPNLRVSHHVAGSSPIKSGDVLRVGCRATCDGYHGLVARTAAVGELLPPVERRYASLVEAHRDLRASLDIGASGGDIYARASLTRRSLGLTLETSHVGHGIGLEFQEPPRLRSGSTDTLKQDSTLMAVSVLNDPDVGHLYIEDMVAIRPDGCFLLSSSTGTDSILPLWVGTKPTSAAGGTGLSAH